MKKYILALTAISFLIAFTFNLRAQSVCSPVLSHGSGFTTSIESVSFVGFDSNGDSLHTIVLRVENDGCTDPDCKALNQYSIEALPGTYSNISHAVLVGNMTANGINLGPSLGGTPFEGFRIASINGIGNGEAGVFVVKYTLTGGLQSQKTQVKAGSNESIVEFQISDFAAVLNCQPYTNILPYYPPPEGGRLDNTLIGPELTSLYYTFIVYDSVETNDIFQIVDDTSVVIEVFSIEGKYAELISLLQSPEYGMYDVIGDPTQNKITGIIPIINLLAIDDLPLLVRYARPVYPGAPQSGIVNSQGDTSLLSFVARNGFNVAGEGIKIGVLSDSYNTNVGNLAADDILRGDLPGPTNPNNTAPVDLLLDYPYGIATDEGRAMMQIIHDIAPKAELAFRTGLISSSDFADGIIELQEAGCDIIVDDITYISEPFLRDGEVAQAVDSVTSLGVSYFTAAGNFGNKSYESTFNPGPAPPGLPGTAHNFAGSGGSDIYQGITVTEGSYIIVLQWDDGLGSSETNTDMDIYLAYDDGARLFGFNRDNIGVQPIEVLPFTVTDTAQTNILIVNNSGPDPVNIKYVVFRGDIIFDEYNSSGGSTIVGQANAEGAITVGAVLYSNTPPYGVNPPSIASFSSEGGTLVNGIDRNKPDVCGPNGVNTTVDLGGFNLEGDPFPNFFGTSAAAPHIAGVAALLLEAKKKYYGADSTITPNQMRTILQNTAVDMDDPGFDNISGAGLVNAAAALATLATPSPLVSEIIYDTSLIPGVDTIPIAVVGQYLTSESEIYFNGQPLNSASFASGDTLVSSIIPPFDENYPEIQVYNSPSALTNGLDGGLSNPLYFSTKPTIIVDIQDTTKKYAEVIPQFSADYHVETPDTIFSLEGAGLSPAAIARIQNIALATVANDTSNVGLWPITVSLEDPLNPTSTVSATDPLDTALLAAFNFEINDGIMTVEKLDLLIVPRDTTIVFGDSLSGFDFEYIYNDDTINPGNNVVIADSVNTAILNAVRQAHATALVNKVATVRATALVNTNGEPLLDSTALANSSFFITNAVARKQATALVNGTLLNALQLYNTVTSSSATALVNAIATVRATALVNGLATVLVNGVATALVNTGTLVNGTSSGSVGSISATALVNTNTVNDSSNSDAIVILGEDDILILAGDSIGDVEIVSVSVITGNTAGEHWIIPGAFVSNNYNINYGLGKITILQDTAEVYFDTTSLVQTYDGTPKEVLALTEPSGLDVELTYDGDTILPTDVGTYLVDATVNDTNYVGWSSAMLTIVPDTAMVSFDSTALTQVYDGTAKVVAASTSPAGLSLIYSFDGTPINVGEYQVTATIDDPNYVGAGIDTLTITPATAYITADNKVIFAGDSLPIFTSTLSGFVGGDDSTVVNSLTYSLNPLYSGSAGSYDIIPSATANNYSFSPVNGTLYVNPSGPGTKFIKTSLICIDTIPPDSSGFTYIAYFEYENKNSSNVFILIGEDNELVAEGSFNGINQPELFLTGEGTFSVPFDGNKLTWVVSSYNHQGNKTSVASQASSTSAKCNKSEEAQLDDEEGLAEAESRAYPNPVTDKIYLELSGEANSNGIFVYDVYGKLNQVQVNRLNNKTYELDLGGLLSGIYIIKVNMGNGLETFRIVKK